ncbi:MAG: hypothetical protein AB8H79_11275 [Myxococcota bacterium]
MPAPIPAMTGLDSALQDRAHAAEDLNQAMAIRDQTHVSALAASAPTVEQAVVDGVTSDIAIEANAAVLQAEKERFSALIFVLAHHGPPLKG